MAIDHINLLFQKPHPHAELMLQYAEDAMETDKPWEKWEVLDPVYNEGWVRLGNNPGWLTSLRYRRKPKPYVPTLLDEALELEIESLYKRANHWVEDMHPGMAEKYINDAKSAKMGRTPEMFAHLKSQGKL